MLLSQRVQLHFPSPTYNPDYLADGCYVASKDFNGLDLNFEKELIF